MDFPSAKEANAAAETISEDGSVVGSSIMMWFSPPHFFKTDKLIVLYVGEDGGIVDILGDTLGPQIAGR